MSWFAQVGHVMRKDLRETRWLIATYAAIVLLSTAHALEWPATSNNVLGVSMLFVVGMGVFVVAALVQADSPTRADAFWASRPFHPSAMLAAKLLFAAIVVAGPALLGQFAAISKFDLSAGSFARLIGKSAYIYAMWLILGMVVAAVTRDLRAFVVTIIAIPVFDALGFAALSWFPAMSGPAHIALKMVSIVGGLVLLAILYRTRDMRRRTWIAAFCIVSGVFYALFGELAPPAAIAESTTQAGDFGLRVEVLHPETIVDRSEVRLVLRLEGPPPAERLTFEPKSVLIHLHDGKTLRTTIGTGIILFTPRLPSGSSIEWLALEDFVGTMNPVHLVTTLKEPDRRAIREGKGIARVVIEGTMFAMAPRLIATLPLTTGASMTREGARVEVVRVSRGSNNATIAVRESSIRLDERPAVAGVLLGGSTLEFALLNTSRGEARMLYKQGSTSQGESLVLPGIDLHDVTSPFQTDRMNDNRLETRVDETWMAGATLMVFDWVLHRQSAVRAETSVP